MSKKIQQRWSIIEALIAQAKEQFEQILSYVQGDAQNQQLNEVKKGIFYALLKLGMTLLLVFFQQRGIGHKSKVHLDKKSVKRRYHHQAQRISIHIWQGEDFQGLLLGKGMSRMKACSRGSSHMRILSKRVCA